ncbi:fungal zn(2)-Cys(6) binuclear cluster domain-containing protein [Rhizoctonia solani AG-1 IA]|uniref:Fungal zn(2)-Cys(6) binuclear cluster domain-containing protein n=1 Tax=Thanatephorus cucumeris (strain AG1-IA) TaxID=983506 RepID=L8WD37_THACA|nr:fungal zn(2)-Cys(6) binuclear cluster domain-containing protein [Rhizoctonia solani AG-1 IA]
MTSNNQSSGPELTSLRNLDAGSLRYHKLRALDTDSPPFSPCIMPRRSPTGCHTCKTKRKKCDETKPKCLRCEKSGAECRYEYIQHAGNKVRTKPAPRPPSERERALLRQSSSFLTTSVLGNSSNISSSLPSPSNCSPSPDARLPVGANQEPLLSKLPLPLSTHIEAGSTLSLPMASRQSAALCVGPSQRSLLVALSSSEKTDSSLKSITQGPPTRLTRLIESNQCTPHVSKLNVDGSIPLKHNTDVEEEYDDDDPEGFEELLCQIPIRLDRTVDSNKFPFVLQCCELFILTSMASSHL